MADRDIHLFCEGTDNAKKIHRTKATFSFFCEQEVDLCSFVFLVETELKSEMTSGSMV